MKFHPPLQSALLLRRYKRFLADIKLPNGEITTIHCPNTGSMKQCIAENSPCWYSISDNPRRKYPFTWEIATTPSGHLAGINTHRANPLVKEAIDNGVIQELQNYQSITPEVKYGEENSRIDFLLTNNDGHHCYVEVKSVTLGTGNGIGLFPDAVSVRGTKHLRELISMVIQGHQAVLLFCVQHTGINQVSPADNIDPEYGIMLRKAIDCGVQVLAYGGKLSSQEIVLTKKLRVLLTP